MLPAIVARVTTPTGRCSPVVWGWRFVARPAAVPTRVCTECAVCVRVCDACTHACDACGYALHAYVDGVYVHVLYVYMLYARMCCVRYVVCAYVLFARIPCMRVCAVCACTCCTSVCVVCPYHITCAKGTAHMCQVKSPSCRCSTAPEPRPCACGPW